MKTSTFEGTTQVHARHRFDETRLAEWLKRNMEVDTGPLRIEQFKGGQSNPTYKVFAGQRALVLRRKPKGQLAKGAHAIEREVQVIQALRKVNYPVAQVHALCNDETVIGSPFYVMEFVEGRVLWDAALPKIASADRPTYYREMIQTLAKLHSVDLAQVGLQDYGRPSGYFSRQVRRWTEQYLADRDMAGADRHIDYLIDWLPRNLPSEERATLVHGDYRIDNLMFHPSEPRLLAVLDWELSTLGEPLADFAYHLLMYRLPRGILGSLGGISFPSKNIPSEQEYTEWYCAATGRDTIENLSFYLAFALFRLAGIFHGIKARQARGMASSANAQLMIENLPTVSKLAWEQAAFHGLARKAGYRSFS